MKFQNLATLTLSSLKFGRIVSQKLINTTQSTTWKSKLVSTSKLEMWLKLGKRSQRLKLKWRVQLKIWVLLLEVTAEILRI
jgi:hypothetical protein